MVHHLNIKSRIICSFIFLLIFSSKDIKADDEVEIKKSSYSIKPSAINLGLDIFAPTCGYITHGMSFHNYNLHSSIDFNRIFIDLDFGVLRYHITQPFELPEPFQLSKGSESPAQQFDNSALDLNFKLGFSYNFLHKNKDHNAIFAGVGYNVAYCQDKLNGELCGNSLDIVTDDHIDTGVQTFFVHWMDIVLGLRMSIFDNFYLGHTVHINILKNFIKENNTCLIPYLIGGYGKEEKSFNLRFEFFIGYNIPLFDDPKFYEKQR